MSGFRRSVPSTTVLHYPNIGDECTMATPCSDSRLKHVSNVDDLEVPGGPNGVVPTGSTGSGRLLSATGHVPHHPRSTRSEPADRIQLVQLGSEEGAQDIASPPVRARSTTGELSKIASREAPSNTAARQDPTLPTHGPDPVPQRDGVGLSALVSRPITARN